MLPALRLMPRLALLTALTAVLVLAARPATAQDEPPFPEYPAFQPEEGIAGDQHLYSLALLDNFEVAPAAADVPAALAGFYRIGNDYTRLWLKAEGEGLLAEAVGEAEVQALYSRLIT